LSELNGIHQVLERIERSQGEARVEFKNLRRELDEAKANHVVHETDNRDDFVRLADSISQFRSAVDKRLTDQTADRQRHLGEQDIKIDAIKADVGKLSSDISLAKGAGWAVVGLLGSGFLLVVGTIVEYLRGIIHIKLG
jgi:hypothetical protein